MCMDMGMDMCMDIDICMDMGMDMCMDIGMCMDMGNDICIDMCKDMCNLPAGMSCHLI